MVISIQESGASIQESGASIQESGASIQESGASIQESGDYFYLFSPLHNSGSTESVMQNY